MTNPKNSPPPPRGAAPAYREPSQYAKRVSKDAVRFERLLPGPIERVWSYLTDSEKRGKWLASGGPSFAHERRLN